jgi:hypothetical protein
MSTLLTGVLRGTLWAILVATLGLQVAHADLYTWVDASGGINVTNLTPPEGVRVTNVIPERSPTTTTVIPERAPTTTTRDEDTRGGVREAQVQTLAKRLQQLEDKVESWGSGSNYWYYCREPAGFYPDVKSCSSAWLQLIPVGTADTTSGVGQ